MKMDNGRKVRTSPSKDNPLWMLSLWPLCRGMSADDSRGGGSVWDCSRSLDVRLCVLNNFIPLALSSDGLPDTGGGASEDTRVRDEMPDAVEISGTGEGVWLW